MRRLVLALLGAVVAVLLVFVGPDLWSTYVATATEGSPAKQGRDYSLLRDVNGGNDNQLVAVDREPDGNTVKAHGFGCHQYWSVTDKNGAFGGSGKKVVPCNLKSHWTSENGNDGPPSKHD